MDQYNVTGMSCAACSARVEKAVSRVSGVTACSVSLLTNSMSVEGSATSDAVIKAVTDAGYGASVKADNTVSGTPANGDTLEDGEFTRTRSRLIVSLLFLLPLMYVSMGHGMWGFPVPGFLSGNHLAMGIFEMLIAGLVMVINQKFFINGFKGLIHGAPNMDTLVSLGSMASFLYSVVVLFLLTASEVQDMPHFYFESAAMILTLITLGKMLEAYSKGRTTDALKGLMSLAPETAVVERNGIEVTVPTGQVMVGDIFILRPGDRIPVDGVVLEGYGAINEAALTGEPLPREVNPGDGVSGSCINTDGFLKCRATKVGKDTTLSQIIKLVSDAAATKAPISKLADRVSGIFVPTVMGISLVTLMVWLIAGESFGFALARAVSVLVISCPCALGLATPVAIMVGNGMGAKNGILFKTAVSLEETGKINIVALDKTGTITLGEPTVTDVLPAEGIDSARLISLAASLEHLSEHPLAKAVTRHAVYNNSELSPVTDFKAMPGKGLSGCVNGVTLYGGNEAFIRSTAALSPDIKKTASELASTGKTPLFFATDKEFLGIIAVSDIIREDSAEAVRQLKALGIHVVMLTGDNHHTAAFIGEKAGVDEVIAEVKPQDKAEIIRRLKEHGKVAMIGDGINDAPALTVADIGIAISSGTDIAMDAADLVLMKNSLKDAVAAIRLSRRTLINIKENLFWAFFYNIIGIPLAAGLWIPVFNLTLNPMFGAAAMSLSSFCVVTNALRLNLAKIYDFSKDKPIRNSVGSEPLIKNTNTMEEKEMTITVKGMMCHHCEMHVEKALEKLEGIEAVKADHTTSSVSFEVTGDYNEALVKAAVEDAGYEFAGTAN